MSFPFFHPPLPCLLSLLLCSALLLLLLLEYQDLASTLGRPPSLNTAAIKTFFWTSSAIDEHLSNVLFSWWHVFTSWASLSQKAAGKWGYQLHMTAWPQEHNQTRRPLSNILVVILLRECSEWFLASKQSWNYRETHRGRNSPLLDACLLWCQYR